MNHQERKASIAKATWNVIARDGLRGATVRSIAKEANLSLGAVRYYFNTHEELIVFAMELVEQQVNERIAQHLQKPLPIKQIIVAALLELVPISEQHIIEMQVWLEFVSYKVRSGEPTEEHILSGIEKIFAYLQHENLLQDGLVVHDEIVHLHAFIDGLALHVLMGLVPMDKVRLQYLIEKEIDKVLKL
ncbi:TetR family transcriptional regulator C-terminal domain-containing protein [Lysinibacillus sp. FSL M8-0337]|uniref:TetR/AcrR family transcriptional regulator n=1 Tax=Lysinibacillus TaxID=400634 RepID=UPI00159F26ED|nr:TetR family transcriptional regulator C-terminal domain-containing protein [Lysinibacillus sphaericus]